MERVVLVVHGGAGNITPLAVDSFHETACRAALAEALLAGVGVLREGGTALRAVEIAVRLMEDFELFNAGRGSVLTSAETVEMDAAIMDGRQRRAGAVGAVKRVKNPVSAALAVMEQSPHVMLVGDAADSFAEERGLMLMEPSHFITPHRLEQFRRAHEAGRISRDHDEDALGTVGAVARDRDGNLAAATSTGGLMNKLPGRVGDSPTIGAGVWADNAACAVSATGDGEMFVRAVFAHEVDALIRIGGLPLERACRLALERVSNLGGAGGCIAVDRDGEIAMPFTTNGMYRGWIRLDGQMHVEIFG